MTGTSRYTAIRRTSSTSLVSTVHGAGIMRHDGTEVRVRHRDPQSGDERGGPVGSRAIQHHVGDA